jgi:integrase
MARPAQGQIVEHRGRDGRTYRSLRFHAEGKRRTLPLGVVTREDAERELGYVMADVARGTWRPPAPAPTATVEAPTFHEFSEEWWTLSKGRWAENTRADYRWRLEVHLLPYFKEMALDQIKARTVDAYIAAKLTEEEPLSARSINMTVVLLGAILERAVKYELLVANPTRGCRAPEREPTRSYLTTAAQIEALLHAAGELDRDATKARRHIERRAMIATLTFAGLRIGELLALRWRDVDLAAGWLTVGDSKTDAGRRRVKVRGALRDELLAVRGRHQQASQAAYVFATARGGRMSPENFRNRVLGRPASIVDGEEKAGPGAVGRANKRLEAEGLPPLPDGLTPHSLRRTFCSLLYALGEDPGTVMDEMGHTHPALALRVYRQAMRRDDEERTALRALVDGRPLRSMTTATRRSLIGASGGE